MKTERIEWKEKRHNPVDHVDPVKRIGQDRQDGQDEN